MLVALVREPASSFVNALSDHPEKFSIDFKEARRQHQIYVAALKQAGVSVTYLPACETFADACFVEDTAVILKDRALICSMKAVSRQGETESIVEAISKYRSLEFLQPPVYIDGGDVLEAGGSFFVGISRRTNQEAVDFLRTQTQKPVIPVSVLRGLHLKSAVGCLNEETLILDPSRVDVSAFKKFRQIKVEGKESYAANCLVIRGHVLMAQGYPWLVEKVEALGLRVLTVPMSEF
ncbi:MAG: arginine deiminase-related protein, partial [Nitrospinota bacterium]|nr:arginine deiminase-related protein [Nitrospinota bacterium]